MIIRTHTVGLFGWLFGDTDKYACVNDGDIESITYDSCGSASVGIGVRVQTRGGSEICGYLPVDQETSVTYVTNYEDE